MLVREIMSRDPLCCTPDTSIRDAARIMREGCCGFLPVIDGDKKAIGVITDRDIVCRVVGNGKDALKSKVHEHLSPLLGTVRIDAEMETCLEAMKQHQIRRVVVADEKGVCVGVISQADLALHIGDRTFGEVNARIVEKGVTVHPGPEIGSVAH